MIRWLASLGQAGKPLTLLADRFVARLNVLQVALRGNLKTIRQPCTSWLRSQRTKARCAQPRATLSSRKQSRRPHEYLTPLLTAEAGQQWGRKDGATTMCLEPCLDKMCCVLQMHVKTS